MPDPAETIPQAPPEPDVSPDRLELAVKGIDALLELSTAQPIAGNAILDLNRLAAKRDRTIVNRAKVTDRFHGLRLFGEGRAIDLRWKNKGGIIQKHDHPCIQVLLKMVEEFESEDWPALHEQDAIKARTLKNGMLKTISDMCVTAHQESKQTMEEIAELVREHQAGKEHEDRMRVAEKTGDQALSDEELLARAAELRTKRAILSLKEDEP